MAVNSGERNLHGFQSDCSLLFSNLCKKHANACQKFNNVNDDRLREYFLDINENVCRKNLTRIEKLNEEIRSLYSDVPDVKLPAFVDTALVDSKVKEAKYVGKSYSALKELEKLLEEEDKRTIELFKEVQELEMKFQNPKNSFDSKKNKRCSSSDEVLYNANESKQAMQLFEKMLNENTKLSEANERTECHRNLKIQLIDENKWTAKKKSFAEVQKCIESSSTNNDIDRSRNQLIAKVDEIENLVEYVMKNVGEANETANRVKQLIEKNMHFCKANIEPSNAVSVMTNNGSLNSAFNFLLMSNREERLGLCERRNCFWSLKKQAEQKLHKQANVILDTQERFGKVVRHDFVEDQKLLNALDLALLYKQDILHFESSINELESHWMSDCRRSMKLLQRAFSNIDLLK